MSDVGASADDLERGAKLWNEKCGRCHRNHTPDDYTDAQWTKILAHMRTKAKLSGDEERLILEFAKSANFASAVASPVP